MTNPLQDATGQPDRTVLPPADPSFRGEIDVAFKDSKADWPEPLRVPKGAPNVLLIMGDDIGYAHGVEERPKPTAGRQTGLKGREAMRK
jgi:hypothetical protein